MARWRLRHEYRSWRRGRYRLETGGGAPRLGRAALAGQLRTGASARRDDQRDRGGRDARGSIAKSLSRPCSKKTAKKEIDCEKKRARSFFAPAPKSFSTTQPASNWATVMRTRGFVCLMAVRRPPWITVSMFLRHGLESARPTSGCGMAVPRSIYSARALRYWFFHRKASTAPPSPMRQDRLACRSISFLWMSFRCGRYTSAPWFWFVPTGTWHGAA